MITQSDFGRDRAGRAVSLFTLAHDSGLTARITNYGGIVTQLRVPDRDGRMGDVVLGYDSLEPYLERHPYLGAIIGRIAGRLTPASFSLDGKDFVLQANQAPHHLHGGAEGFDRRTWQAHVAGGGGQPEALELHYRSPDGEEGYPGNVAVKVGYSLTSDRALQIDYEALTDQATPLSLTNHSYFNLAGAGDIRSHELQIFADEYTPVAADFSHTGRRVPVAGLSADFRQSQRIGSRLEALAGRHGDHYLLRPKAGELTLAAKVKDPETGRLMEVLTSQPCLQFYTGVSLEPFQAGKGGRAWGQFGALCLECQGYPAAPHFREFEPIFLYPGEIYRHRTVYRFAAE